MRVVYRGNRPETGEVRDIKTTAADIQGFTMEIFRAGWRKNLLNSRIYSSSQSRGPRKKYSRMDEDQHR